MEPVVRKMSAEDREDKPGCRAGGGGLAEREVTRELGEMWREGSGV